jgi:hypothetical protein
MKITLRPVGRGGRYAALLNGRILVESRTPIFSAGRVLLSEGASPDEALTASHDGSAVASMTTIVGKAARLTVIERDSGGIHIAPYDASNAERLRSLQGGRPGSAFCVEMNSAVVQPETASCDHHRA